MWAGWWMELVGPGMDSGQRTTNDKQAQNEGKDNRTKILQLILMVSSRSVPMEEIYLILPLSHLHLQGKPALLLVTQLPCW